LGGLSGIDFLEEVFLEEDFLEEDFLEEVFLEEDFLEEVFPVMAEISRSFFQKPFP
jgi:hypothetical protein